MFATWNQPIGEAANQKNSLAKRCRLYYESPANSNVLFDGTEIEPRLRTLVQILKANDLSLDCPLAIEEGSYCLKGTAIRSSIQVHLKPLT